MVVQEVDLVDVLARFYAAQGRSDEARARMKRCFELRPELRDYAKNDPELAKLNT